MDCMSSQPISTAFPRVSLAEGWLKLGLDSSSTAQTVLLKRLGGRELKKSFLNRGSIA